jgi:plastocyanin
VRRKNKSPLIAGLFLVVSTQSLAEVGSLSRQETAQLNGRGRIVGRVRIEGRYQRPPPLKVYKNRDFCGAEVPDETLLVNSDAGLQNVVIILSGARAETRESRLKGLVLDNKNCAFVPHVQVAPVGSEVLFLNSDPILHDVHARLGSETLFNVGLPNWRQVKKQLSRTGIIRIECEVLHTWMSAYIVVTSSRYFAVTDAKGEFAIESVIPGGYEMEAWHEKLGRQARRMTVTGGSMLRVDFVYRLGKGGT